MYLERTPAIICAPLDLKNVSTFVILYSDTKLTISESDNFDFPLRGSVMTEVLAGQICTAVDQIKSCTAGPNEDRSKPVRAKLATITS